MDITNIENENASAENSVQVENSVQADEVKSSPRRGRPKKTASATSSSTEKLGAEKLATKKPVKVEKSEKLHKTDKNVKAQKPVKARSTKRASQADKDTQESSTAQTVKIPRTRKALKAMDEMSTHCHAHDTHHKEHCAHRNDEKACHDHHAHDAHHDHNHHGNLACHEHHTHHDCQPHHDVHHTLSPQHPCFERAQKIKKKRKIAKIGMTASLGLLTLTAFSHVLPYTKKTHTIAGLAMLGFSLWHANLYNNPHKKVSAHKKVSVKQKTEENKEQIKSCLADQKPQTA